MARFCSIALAKSWGICVGIASGSVRPRKEKFIGKRTLIRYFGVNVQVWVSRSSLVMLLIKNNSTGK